MNMIHVVFLFLHQNVFNQKTLNRQTAYTIHGLMPASRYPEPIPVAEGPECDPSVQSCPYLAVILPCSLVLQLLRLSRLQNQQRTQLTNQNVIPRFNPAQYPGCDPSLQSCPPAPTPEPSPEPAPVTTPLPTSSCDPSIQSCPPPVDSGGNPVCDPSEWTCASKTYAKVPIEGYSVPMVKQPAILQENTYAGGKRPAHHLRCLGTKLPMKYSNHLEYMTAVQGWGNIPMENLKRQ